MSLKHILSYIRNHWKGNYSLAFSFWINLVMLSGVIRCLEPFITHLYPERPRTHLNLAIIYFVFSRLVVYPWQAMGVLRASERAIFEYYHTTWWPRVAQVIVVMGIVVVFVESQGFIRSEFLRLRQADRLANIQHEAKKSFALKLENNCTTLHLEGQLDFGITNEVKEFLSRHTGIERITLDSEGGPVSEGRGLAMLIRKHKLDTYSLKECSSACTIAFIAGAKRLLGINAKLGFHQYRLDAKNVIPFLDLNNELKKDLAFYKSQSIDEAFLKQVFKTPHKEIWFPNHDELLKASVIHGVVDPAEVIEP